MAGLVFSTRFYLIPDRGRGSAGTSALIWLAITTPAAAIPCATATPGATANTATTTGTASAAPGAASTTTSGAASSSTTSTGGGFWCVCLGGALGWHCGCGVGLGRCGSGRL
jgi:hypothetical protein